MAKAIWIIDAAYLYKSASLGQFDYLKLKTELEKYNKEHFYESYYLNASANPLIDSHDSFHTWLKSAPPHAPGIRVKFYPLKKQSLKCPHCHQDFDREIQKAVDVGIATLIISLAIKNKYDRLFLSTGDGDFEDAVAYVKDELNKEICLVGYKERISPDLQSYADEVIWLDDLWDNIKK